MPKKIKSYFLLIVFIFSSLNGMETFVPLFFNIQNTVKNNYAFITTIFSSILGVSLILYGIIGHFKNTPKKNSVISNPNNTSPMSPKGSLTSISKITIPNPNFWIKETQHNKIFSISTDTAMKHPFLNFYITRFGKHNHVDNPLKIGSQKMLDTLKSEDPIDFIMRIKLYSTIQWRKMINNHDIEKKIIELACHINSNDNTNILCSIFTCIMSLNAFSHQYNINYTKNKKFYYYTIDHYAYYTRGRKEGYSACQRPQSDWLGRDKEMLFYKTEDNSLVLVLFPIEFKCAYHKNIILFAANPISSTIKTTCSLFLYDLKSNKQVTLYEKPYQSFDISPNGKYVVIYIKEDNKNEYINLYNITNFDNIKLIEKSKHTKVNNLQFSPDSKTLIFNKNEDEPFDRIILWNIKNNTQRMLCLNTYCDKIIVNKDNKHIYISRKYSNGTYIPLLLNGENLQQITTFPPTYIINHNVFTNKSDLMLYDIPKKVSDYCHMSTEPPKIFTKEGKELQHTIPIQYDHHSYINKSYIITRTFKDKSLSVFTYLVQKDQLIMTKIIEYKPAKDIFGSININDKNIMSYVYTTNSYYGDTKRCYLPLPPKQMINLIPNLNFTQLGCLLYLCSQTKIPKNIVPLADSSISIPFQETHYINGEKPITKALQSFDNTTRKMILHQFKKK
jgi:hypothetical protein